MWKTKGIFRGKYLPHLAILADYVAIAVDNVRNLQKLQARTFIDEVTGFYNTRYLIQKLDRLIPQHRDRGEHFSLVFLDLDNFKAVVDTHGHLRGAEVLSEVARVITGSWGRTTAWCAMAGMSSSFSYPGSPSRKPWRSPGACATPSTHTAFLQHEGLRIKLTASYGIATLPEDAQDRETLLFIADQALFSSKGRGRDRIMLARDLMAESEGRHSSRAAGLRQAWLREEKFKVHGSGKKSQEPRPMIKRWPLFRLSGRAKGP